METFTLEQASYLAEIIGVFAVVISLIYVGVQVKQNSHFVKLSTVHNIAEGQREINSLMAENGELLAIIHKGLQDIDSLSGVDKFRFYVWAYAAFRPFEDAYFQFLEGALDERHWQALSRQFTALSTTSGLKTYWDERKLMYSDDFQKYMDSEVMTGSGISGYKLVGT